MVTVRESEIDGVPCFWVETGRPTLAASLMFRQGLADEPLHESGWLHLLEHMALHGSGNGVLHVNGSVSTLVTTFDTHGPVDAVADHLTRVATWLGDPRLEGVERERGVLRAESELRGGPLVNSMRWRYGATGPGVASYGEPGLVRANPEALWDRCRHVFNRGNAVLVLDGPPPRRLRLGLADGSYHPARPAVSVESEFPAAYEERAGLVLSGVVDRSHDATVAASLLENALRQEVRDRAGAAYAPWSVYESVDADTAVIAAGSDLLPDALPMILEKSLVLLERLQAGVGADLIEEQVSVRLQALRDPYNAMAIAMRTGHAVLRGDLPPTYDDLVAEAERTDREEIRKAFHQLRSTLLLGAPTRTRLPQRIRRAAYPSSPPWQDARAHRHRNWPLDRSRFSSGASGVEIVEGGKALQVASADVAGLMTWRDGARHLIGRDGWGITMVPDEWHHGTLLTRAIDALVPAELHLLVDGVGSRGFRRLSWAKRWSPPLRRGIASAPGLALLAVVLAVVGIAASAAQVSIVAGASVLAAFVALLRVPSAYLRGRRRLW